MYLLLRPQYVGFTVYVQAFSLQSLHFGSNSSAARNPGTVVRGLSWDSVSMCLFHYISMETASHAQTFLCGL